MKEETGFLAGIAVLILAGIAILILARLVSRASDPLGDDRAGRALRILGWTLIVLGLAPGGLLSIIAAIVVVGIWLKRREARQHALLWVLTVSAERSLPLVPAVEAFASESSRGFARKARRLAAMLLSGVPLPEALQRCRGLLPWQALPLLWVGEGSGGLAPALRRAASMEGDAWQTWEALAGKLAYLGVVPCFGIGILSFIMLKIVPQFVKVFRDFGTELPPLTRGLIAAANAFAAFGYLFLVGFPLLLGILVYIVLRYWGVIHWDLPGMGRLTRRADTALLFEALALAAQRQRPLPEAIAILAREYPKAAIRRRLALALQDVHRGGDWSESLLRRGLMRQADQAVLQAAQRVGNLAWALAEMADSNRRRLNYRMYALVQLLFPPVVLAMGLSVMFVVVSLFLPLISLIHKLIP